MFKHDLVADFLLLSYAPDGKPMIDNNHMNAGVAAAAFVELVQSGALELDESHKKPEKWRCRATGKDIGDPAMEDLAKAADGQQIADAVAGAAGITSFHGRTKDLTQAVLEGLQADGELRREEGKFLGIFRKVRWVEADGSHEGEVVEQIRACLTGVSEPDERTATLISLVNAVGILPKLFPDMDKKEVKARGKEISEGNWGARSVKATVEAAEAALITVITTSSAVAATSN